VADHGHGGRTRDAGALEIADRRAAKVVRNPKREDDRPTVPLDDAREARAPTRRDPRSPE